MKIRLVLVLVLLNSVNADFTNGHQSANFTIENEYEWWQTVSKVTEDLLTQILLALKDLFGRFLAYQPPFLPGPETSRSPDVEDMEGQSSAADKTEDEVQDLKSSTTATTGATNEVDMSTTPASPTADQEMTEELVSDLVQIVSNEQPHSQNETDFDMNDAEADKSDGSPEVEDEEGESGAADETEDQEGEELNSSTTGTTGATKEIDEDLEDGELEDEDDDEPVVIKIQPTPDVVTITSSKSSIPETASDSQKEEGDDDHAHESDDSPQSGNGITGTGDSIPVKVIQDEYAPTATPNEYQDSNSHVMPNDIEQVQVEVDVFQGQEVSGTDSERAEPEANTTPHLAYSPEAESNILETESSSSAHSNAATVDVDKDTGEATSQEIHDHDPNHRDQDYNNQLPINSADKRAQNATAEYSTASSTISEPEATHSNTISDTVEPSVAEQEQEQDPAEDSSANAKNSSFVIVVKYLSSSLLSFLPEHLQDTILDVNYALVFTGIIVLLTVGVGLCVPYFFVKTFLSSRSLKKKVVDLNKALWKVSAAYECQQDQIKTLEAELVTSKTRVQELRDEGKKRAKLEAEVIALVQMTMTDLAKVKEERNKYASAVVSLKKTLKKTTEDLELTQAKLNSKTIDLELLVISKDFTENRVKVSENETAELQSKLASEITLRKETQEQLNELNQVRETLQEDLTNLRKITLQYEETVNNLTAEINLKENELYALKDSSDDDSPLVEIAEIKAKLSIAEKETKSLQSGIDSITLENKTLTRNYEESSETLVSVTAEKDEALKTLEVLKAYLEDIAKERWEIMKRQQAERERQDINLNETISFLEELQDEKTEIQRLNARILKIKQELIDTKNQHQKDLRDKDTEIDRQWLVLMKKIHPGLRLPFIIPPPPLPSPPLSRVSPIPKEEDE